MQQNNVKYAILTEDIYASHLFPGFRCIDIIYPYGPLKAAGRSHYLPQSSHLRAGLLVEAANVTGILGIFIRSLRGETKSEVDRAYWPARHSEALCWNSRKGKSKQEICLVLSNEWRCLMSCQLKLFWKH